MRASALALFLSLLAGCAAPARVAGDESYEADVAAARLAAGSIAEAGSGVAASEKRAIAERGLAHARAAIERDARRVEGHYFAAVLLGRKLENDWLPARKLGEASAIKSYAQDAARLDERFECAGAHRLLGVFHTSAPWPLGDWDEGVSRFERAVAIFPECAEAHIDFADGLANGPSETIDRAVEEIEAGARLLLAPPTGHDLHPGARARAREVLARLREKLEDDPRAAGLRELETELEKKRLDEKR